MVIAAVILALDVALGFLFRKYMDSHTLPGDYEMADHVLRGFDEDAVVLGSSVALNSINARTLQDSIGVTVFNGGANGQTFPFYLTMLLLDILLSQLMSVAAHAIRIGMYFSAYTVLWVPAMYSALKQRHQKLLFCSLVILYLMAYFLYNYVLQGRNQIYPYAFAGI